MAENADAPWPATLPISAAADARAHRPPPADGRRLGGQVRGGRLAGRHGNASAAVELVGEHATVTLSLLVNPATGELRQADVSL